MSPFATQAERRPKAALAEVGDSGSNQFVPNVPMSVPNCVETRPPVVQVNWVIDPPPCDTENAHDWIDTFALLSSVSVITTLRAMLGPRLSTKIVYVNTCPARTVPCGSEIFVTRRSARSWMKHAGAESTLSARLVPCSHS